MIDHITYLKKIKAGDEEAKSAFIKANEGLIYALIQRFVKYHSKDDLYQVACIGMMKAINGFDFQYQVTFSTYAVPIILGELKHYLRSDQKIHISRNIKETYYKLLKCKEELSQVLNKEVQYEDLSIAMNMDLEDVIFCFEANQQVMSMDEILYDEQGNEMNRYDMIADQKSNKQYHLLIKQLMKTLPLKQQQIIYDHYILGYNQSEIAQKLNLSQVQISRIIKKALVTMKNHV